MIDQIVCTRGDLFIGMPNENMLMNGIIMLVIIVIIVSTCDYVFFLRYYFLYCKR